MPPKSRKPTNHQPKKQYKAPDPAALVFTRRQSCRALSCSVAKIVRLENAGILDKIKMNPAEPNGQVYHKKQQVLALAGVAHDQQA